MLAVGNDFNGHVVDKVNAFHCALVFELMALVESRHCVVKVRGVRESHLVSRAYIVVVGLRMRQARQRSVLHARASEFHGAGQFGCLVPTFYAPCRVEYVLVFR